MKVFNGLLVLCLFCWSTTLVSADTQIRILLSFDNAGHHVSQVFRTEAVVSLSARSRQASATTDQLSTESLISELQPQIATLVWFDAQGRKQSTSHEPDPRIAYGPAHIDGTDSSVVTLTKGAWLVSGPEEASKLTILLPADISIGLGFEQWDVFLPAE